MILMAKFILSLSLICISLGGFTQAVSDSSTENLILQCMRNHHWLPHQFFEMIYKDGDPLPHCFNGIDESLLANEDSLRKDARRLAEEMIAALKPKVNLESMPLYVYYFDKNSHLLGKCKLFNLYVVNNKIASSEEAPLENLSSAFGKVDFQARQGLRKVRLSANQHLIPGYLDTRDSKSEYDKHTACLVNLVDILTKKDRHDQSKRQYIQLLRTLLPASSLHRVIIRYRERCSRKESDYVFEIN